MTIGPDLLAWQHIRRHMVSRAMIHECTDLRAAGDWRGACAAAGVEVTFDPAEHVLADLRRLTPDLLRGQVPLAPVGLPCQLTADLAVEVPAAGSRRLRLSLREPTGTFLDLAPWHWDATATDDLTTSLAAETRRVAERYGVAGVGVLTRTVGSTTEGPLAWPGPPDADLLRHKLITPADLHPLIAAAHQLRCSRTTALLAPVPVRCQGEWHTLVHDGELRAVWHEPEAGARGAAFGALGGPVSGCLRVQRAWVSGGWVPKPLQQLRSAIRDHLVRGEPRAVEALLDAGLDLQGRDRHGATLLHQLGLLSTYVREPWPTGRYDLHTALLTRLLDAGIPVDVRDTRGRNAAAGGDRFRGQPAAGP